MQISTAVYDALPRISVSGFAGLADLLVQSAEVADHSSPSPRKMLGR
jgi:hypothetical protein